MKPEISNTIIFALDNLERRIVSGEDYYDYTEDEANKELALINEARITIKAI